MSNCLTHIGTGRLSVQRNETNKLIEDSEVVHATMELYGQLHCVHGDGEEAGRLTHLLKGAVTISGCSGVVEGLWGT